MDRDGFGRVAAGVCGQFEQAGAKKSLTRRKGIEPAYKSTGAQPTALPDNGSPGDVYKVGHCSRLTQQNWTFTWGQITQGKWGWIGTSYATSMVVRCSAEPGPL